MSTGNTVSDTVWADSVLVERHGARADVVLNRPERRNALVAPMMARLRDVLLELSADGGVNAILLRGAGGALCSGLDLKAINAEPRPEWAAHIPRIWREANVALACCAKPVVCALEKYAINGGGPLAFGSDFVVAGETAYIQVMEVKIGMAAPINLAWLQAKYGEAIARRFALLGEPVRGPELLRLGVATQVVPDDQVLARATALADQLAAYPAAAAQNIKRSIRALGHGLDDPQAWFAKAQANL